MSDLSTVPLIIRGEVIEDNLIVHEGRGGGSSFRTPDVNKHIDQLPLRSHGDMKDLHALSTDEIIDFLVRYGEQLDISENAFLQQALEEFCDTAPTTPPIQDDFCKVIGGDHDEGAIIVSQLPGAVEFDSSLNDRVANFIPVDSVEDIARDCDAYTQTAGVYPESLKSEIRDLLPLYGAQRITSLGYACAADSTAGPHDGIEPLRRMAKWLVDENCDTCAPKFNTPPWLGA